MEKKNPLVSVIMSTYNEKESELREAIDSILNQSFENYELIIVNDNPDNELLRNILYNYELDYSCIKILWNETNIGLAKSLNRAISKASGKYIMRMDADDISVKDRMFIESLYLDQNSECALVSGNKMDMNTSSEIISKSSGFKIADEEIYKIMLYGTIIIHPSVMIRKSVLINLGGYREIDGAEDYDLWLRMISEGYKIHIIEQPVLLYYRIREESITRKNYANMFYRSKYAVELYKERLLYDGKDSFSKENLDVFLRRKCKIQEREKIINEMYTVMQKASKIKLLIWVLKHVFTNPYIFEILMRAIKFKIKVSKYVVK